MSNISTTNQVIALAGMSQACLLVKQIANTGTADNTAIKTCLNSILKIDSTGVIEIYGDLNQLKPGLKQLELQLTGRAIADPEQARYAASLVFLEKQLSKHSEMQQKIQIGVESSQALAEVNGVLDENVVANLGDLYHSTISTLEPRIMVNGDPQILTQAKTINMIRALLLAGIRSTLLWRQCGGSRWKFIFYRKKLQDEIKFLISQTD